MVKFHHKQIVRFNDTDAAGIVYFGAFATYFDESFLAALRKEGIGWHEHRKYGFLMPIVEQQIRFYHPLRVGESIDVTMVIEKLGNRSFTSHHKIYLKNDQGKILVADGTISRVVVDYHEFTAIAIPSHLLNCFNKYLNKN